MNIDELRQLVERKTETVKMLEAILEKEETELVELEATIESLEDEKGRQTHEHARRA
jgi:hypothetical protein